ncbi:MAG: glycoside hydrolase family 43 protein [Acidimicrobiales bacterium]
MGIARAVYNGDVGDPFVLTLTDPTRYIVFGTDDPPARVPTATSTDLIHWTSGPDAFPVLPSWAAPDPRDDSTWAPAVLAAGAGRFVLYVSVRDQRSGRECIAVATSAKPDGPYTNHSRSPLVCQVGLGGSIDPSVSRDRKGVLHLVWKSDGNAIGIVPELWQQALTPDGLGLSGSPHLLLRADLPWQGGIIEGPSLLAATRGGWWLFYSGNAYYRAAYGTGVAYCPKIDGPCRDIGPKPLLTTAAGQFSPGGLETFRSAHGRLMAAFATWSRRARNGIFYCCRALSIAPVIRH